MSTIIYPSPIFGPVHSRRLGISLGINLMPADGKICTFNCIYCECGLNEDYRPTLPRPTRKQVAKKLEAKLKAMATEGQLPDVLTFAGNGEPTCHPQFAEIIGDTIALRDQYCPKAKVSVLSNATMIHRQAVHDALMLVDNNIQKLDTVDPLYINKVDQPVIPYDVDQVIERLKAFQGHVIIQTMFMRGSIKRSMVNGQWSMVNGQWSMVNGIRRQYWRNIRGALVRGGEGHQAPAGDDLHHRPRDTHPRPPQSHPRAARPDPRPRHRRRHPLHRLILNVKHSGTANTWGRILPV